MYKIYTHQHTLHIINKEPTMNIDYLNVYI